MLSSPPMLLTNLLLVMPYIIAFQPSPSCHRIPIISSSGGHNLQFASNSRMRTTIMHFTPEDDHTSDHASDFDLFNAIIDQADDKEEHQVMDELAWRSKKVSLEEEETKRFQKRLKSKPWKLPYGEASKWVQANFGVETKEEFFDLVANGNLRTPYVPKDPEKFYSEKGTWVSWQHFLGDQET